MKIKHSKLYKCNFVLLEKFTGYTRKDASALKAWNDLFPLIMYGKTYGISSRRQKRWIHKIRDNGYCEYNIHSGKWRLNQAGGQIIVEYVHGAGK